MGQSHSLPPHVPEVNHNLRDLALGYCRVHQLQAQERGPLGGAPARSANEADAGRGLPVSGFRVEVQEDEASASEIAFALRDVVLLDYRCGYPFAGGVEEEPKPAIGASASSGGGDKDSSRAQFNVGRERDPFIPLEADPILLGNLVRVSDADLARVGVLCSSRDESALFFNDRHEQGTAAQSQQISSAIEVLANWLPHIGRDGRTIREHEQVGVLESVRFLEIGYSGKNRLRITECLQERLLRNRLAFDNREPILPENDHFAVSGCN